MGFGVLLRAILVTKTLGNEGRESGRRLEMCHARSRATIYVPSRRTGSTTDQVGGLLIPLYSLHDPTRLKLGFCCHRIFSPRLLKLDTSRGILVGVYNTISATYTFSLLHSSTSMCYFKDARAGDVIVALFDCLCDFM